MASLNEIQAGFDVAYFRISDSVKLIGMTDRDEAGRWAARHVMMLIILFIQRSWRRGGQFARKKQSICAARFADINVQSIVSSPAGRRSTNRRVCV